jgi:iron(III) transport system substrate-binding protein
MRTVRSALVACALLVAALAASACGSDDGDSGATATGSAATTPAKLTVYSGRDEELVGPLLDRYAEETGVELEVRYGDSAELAALIREEGDKSPADVYFGQDAGALGALSKEGLLAKLPQETLERVDASQRAADGTWVGTSGRVRVIAYDTRELRPADLPDSVLDLTDERWRGKVGWAPTNASFQAFVTALRKVEGEQAAEDWLVAMRENDTQVYERNGLIRDAIADGEIQLGLINHYYVMQKRAEEKDPESYPVGLHFPPNGDVGSLINVAGAGVLASSSNQEAATALVDFLLSAEAQEYFRDETAEYPVAAGVEPSADLPPLDQIAQPQLDLGDLDDLEGTLRLLERAGVL